HTVAFGVNPGAIERVVAVANLEESGRLDEALLADTVDLQQLPAIAERAVRLAMFDKIAGDKLIETGHVAKQRHAGRIQIDANLVDARFNDTVERFTQLLGGYIVLVQTNADVLRVDFHQLTERILQAAADRDGAAQARIKMGKLFLADGTGR